MISVAVGDVMVVQLFPDKRQTRRKRRLCRVGRCSRDRLGGSTTLLRIAIFPTIGNQACVGQWGRIHTPVALSSFIFFITAIILQLY